MKNACSWKYNAGWIAWMLLLSGALLMAVGCDAGADPAVEQVGNFAGELILAEDKPVSGGVMKVTLEIAPPDDIVSPINPVGGALTPRGKADIHFEAQIRYAKTLLGGRAVGEFVPYLDVELELTNRDSGKKSKTWTLVPHVGIAEGYHYARNIALVDTLGASEAGYDAKVTIRQPIPPGNSATTAISPGTVMQSDIAGDVTGTLLGATPTVVRGGFILGDFKNIASEEMGTTGEEESSPGSALPDEVYMY